MANLLLVNPRKRRKTTSKKRRSPRKSLARRASTSISTITKRVKKYRRNPIQKVGVINQFKDGAIGAAGALAVDVAMSKLPIPPEFKTGQFAPIVKGFVGIGIGMLVAKFGKSKKLGEQLASGAVTVSLYMAGRQMLAPTLGLSGISDSLLGYDDGLLGGDELNAYENMGAYESMEGGDELGVYDDGLGYVTGAPIVG